MSSYLDILPKEINKQIYEYVVNTRMNVEIRRDICFHHFSSNPNLKCLGCMYTIYINIYNNGIGCGSRLLSSCIDDIKTQIDRLNKLPNYKKEDKIDKDDRVEFFGIFYLKKAKDLDWYQLYTRNEKCIIVLNVNDYKKLKKLLIDKLTKLTSPTE